VFKNAINFVYYPNIILAALAAIASAGREVPPLGTKGQILRSAT
jgi:hypothetical protein